jgi:hypothetical protein
MVPHGLAVDEFIWVVFMKRQRVLGAATFIADTTNFGECK